MPVCYGAGSALGLRPRRALSSVRIVVIGPTLTLSRHHNQQTRYYHSIGPLNIGVPLIER